jgi:8-oxo-dGTP diphosphatase
VRAVFFDEEDAAAVAARLRADGFEAELVRERLAGEDDDEDHPWVVLTDAPALLVESLLEEYDGWLDDAPPADAPPATPLDLPQAPRRVKGQPRGE